MVKFTIWDEATGIIKRSGDCGDPETQRRPGERIIEGEDYADDQWRVDPATGEAYAWTRPKTHDELVADIIRERERRLAQGFDFDFGDERGVHRIGTAADDMDGWDEVTKLASAMIAAGQPNSGITVVTDAGPVVVTALEWQTVLIAAGAFRQPIWAASFVLHAMDPIPQDITNPAHWE